MNDAVFKRDLAHSGINEPLAIITNPPIGVFASVVGRGISFSKLPFCSLCLWTVVLPPHYVPLHCLPLLCFTSYAWSF
jgi:hypothetical protein